MQTIGSKCNNIKNNQEEDSNACTRPEKNGRCDASTNRQGARRPQTQGNSKFSATILVPIHQSKREANAIANHSRGQQAGAGSQSSGWKHTTGMWLNNVWQNQHKSTPCWGVKRRMKPIYGQHVPRGNQENIKY